jgi:hypothetical protein
MKKTLLIILAITSCFALLGGCSGGETTATKADEEAFRKPPSEPPADLSQKMEQAAAAGRDSHQTETR